MTASLTVLYRVHRVAPAHVQLTPEQADGRHNKMSLVGLDSVRFPDLECAGLKLGELVRLRVERVDEKPPATA